MIRIYIGTRSKNSRPYIVPRYVLCESSRYFEKALSSTFVEGQTGTLHFPEDNEAGWRVLLYFIIRKQVVEFVELTKGETNAHSWALAHAYILADKYEIPACQNAIVRAIIEHLRYSVLSLAQKTKLLSVLPAGSHLQRIILEELVDGRSLEHYEWEQFEPLFQYEGVCTGLLRAAEHRWDGPDCPPFGVDASEEALKGYLVNE